MQTTAIRGLVAQIRGIRAELAENLQAVSDDWRASDDFKLMRRNALIDEASEELRKLAEKVDETLPDMGEYKNMMERFDYTDVRLSSAIQLVRTEGKALPETAWRQMVNDFSRRPAMLLYMSEVFGENGLIGAAMAAKETAQRVGYTAGTPHRLAESIYYSATTNPEKEFDFSEIYRDMDVLDNIESELAEPPAEAV